MQEKTIPTNVHVARSVQEACNNGRDQVAMLQIDLDKAFDRVGHYVLFDVLDRANVVGVILKGVKLAYQGRTTRLIVNKELSDIVFVRSPVTRGYPMSPLLFDLYLERFV